MKTFALLGAVVLLNVVTGQDAVCNGSCVETWKKCAGEGIPSGTMRPCCSESAHCVEKTSKYSQCRPKSQAIPSSWSGAIITCTDPPACDPTTVVALVSGLSANWYADNAAIELDRFGAGYLFIHDTDCLTECQANDDCFAFDETSDGDCTLFGKNLFWPDTGNLQPFFDGDVHLTKCFLPEPLCDPATREVRRMNPTIAPDGRPHQMSAMWDERDFFASPADYTLTAAINACRLNQRHLGGCIGFVIDGSAVGDGYGRLIKLLYRRGPGTVNYRGDLAEDPEVYSIEACL